MSYKPAEFGELQVTFTATTGTITVDTTQDTLAWTRNGRLCHVQGVISVTSVSTPTFVLTMVGALPFNPATLTESGDAHQWIGHCAGMNPGTILTYRGLVAAASKNITLSAPDGTFLADNVQANTTIGVNFQYITD